jgi:hypothetical protein
MNVMKQSRGGFFYLVFNKIYLFVTPLRERTRERCASPNDHISPFREGEINNQWVI